MEEKTTEEKNEQGFDFAAFGKNLTSFGIALMIFGCVILCGFLYVASR